MTFGPLPSQLNLPELEAAILARWRDDDLATKVRNSRIGASPWVFYEGPPTANGRPGLHHVWARVFKDLFPRFQVMRGRNVPRKGGWDCHGLPVEIEVEKELGLRSKAEIETFGIGAFNDRCRASVQRYVGDWESLTERAGVWIDTDDAYWTLSNEYIESVWWLLAQLYEQGLLYEGHRVVPYCRRCGTALSSHELGQPGAYRDITDRSVYVRFPLVEVDADLLVWTTTPWTLLSNVAIAVGAEIDYVRVPDAGGGRDLIMAQALAPTGSTPTAKFTGEAMVGWSYRRPFELIPIPEGAQRVVTGDFVTTDEGSGLVHIAPAFGTDDMELARTEGLPVLNPMGADGAFDATAGPFAGQIVKDSDEDVIAALATAGLLVREAPYLHSYPHCWRCGTGLIYWAKTSWFIATSQQRQPMLAANDNIDWHPEHIRHGRFGDWLENNIDWALSRDRYWGTPLPIWRCEAGHDTCIGSIARLGELAGRDLTDLDLHRPHVDNVNFPCPQMAAPGFDLPCGSTARRLGPVLDAWFDSGSMPAAQHHHPFRVVDPSKPQSFPADFICEAIDQTRGWFYSLLATNTLVFGQSPYKAVVCLGLLVDETGQKMSKSKGNVVDPWDIFARFGADALRWYFFSAGSPWSNRRISEDAIRESARTLVTLWNVFAGFFVTYADIEGWQPPPRNGLAEPHGEESHPAMHVMDGWVLERLDAAIAEVTNGLESFDAFAAASALGDFIDSLSNWYVRRSRSRFWTGSPPFGVLHRCLTVTAQLLGPFCPFLADEIYRVLTGRESVHLSDWPEPRAPAETPSSQAGDDTLSDQMKAALRLVGLGRQAREQARVGTRQPLRRALLLHPGALLSPAVLAEVADELNVKAFEAVTDLGDLISWQAIANFRALGPRLGPRVGEVGRALASADGSWVRRVLESDGFVEIAGERLGPEDIELRAMHHDQFSLVQDGAWAVALDLELDPALECERVARQTARALNDLRKQLGLALSDRIVVRADPGPLVTEAINAHRAWISAQVLATEIRIGPIDGDANAIEIETEPSRFVLQVVEPTA